MGSSHPWADGSTNDTTIHQLMNGTNRNMQIRKIASLIKYLSTIGYLFYKSISFALLLYIAFTSQLALLRFSIFCFQVHCNCLCFAAIYFFYKSVSFTSLLYISFILLPLLLLFASIYLFCKSDGSYLTSIDLVLQLEVSWLGFAILLTLSIINLLC